MSEVNKIKHYDSQAEITSEIRVEENNIIRLSAEDQMGLAETILNPLQPTPAMLRARENYARIIRKAC